MKFAIIVLFLLPVMLSAASIVGVWKFEYKGQTRLLEIKEDSTYAGHEPISGDKAFGKYTLLKDGSGVVIYNAREGQSMLLDIRELTEERLIIQLLHIAAVMERVDDEEAKAIREEQQIQLLKRRPELHPIVMNLRQIASGGQQYILEERVESVAFDQIEGIYFKKIEPVNGESYDDLVVNESRGTLKVTDKDGVTHIYKY